jgi:hypothetical protein
MKRTPRLVTGQGQVHDMGLPYHIVGHDQNDRGLKSRFEDGRQAIQMARLSTYIRMLYDLLMRKRAEAGKPILTMRQAMEEYAGLRSYQELHLRATGHLVSVDGFSIKASVEAAKLAQAEAAKETVVVQQATGGEAQHGANGNGAPRYG